MEKLRNKILATLCALLCVCVSSLVLTTVSSTEAKAQASVWSGSVSTASYEETGNGTEKRPYKIETGEDLALLAQKVNAGTDYAEKFFELTADIDLGSQAWTPIGTFTSDEEGNETHYPFSGTFNGNGHTVSGLYADTEYMASLFSFEYP